MFNSSYKKEAIEECERAGELYKKTHNTTIKDTEKLYSYRQNSVRILKSVDYYIHSLSNRPEYLNKKAEEIYINRKAFENEIHNIQKESKKYENISKNVAGAGVVAGTGVAAFGPTAAMAVATTFGTASTGTAIATLSGAAATNAALAWLGGGALVAGGGGMAAGEAFLALAGPVGWAIGGVGLLGGGLMANSKNKKIAEKAERQTREIKKEIDNLKRIDKKVCSETQAIYGLNDGVEKTLNEMISIPHRDYSKFTSKEKDMLFQLMNTSQTLSKRIGIKIS